mmetsp:Transcript_5865/g.15471  ORF Transcript_5865/g.15471 Transcript_5865/m.15471 type:complete len:241 (-) Transcript_5865:756-1478(-)
MVMCCARASKPTQAISMRPQAAPSRALHRGVCLRQGHDLICGHHIRLVYQRARIVGGRVCGHAVQGGHILTHFVERRCGDLVTALVDVPRDCVRRAHRVIIRATGRRSGVHHRVRAVVRDDVPAVHKVGVRDRRVIAIDDLEDHCLDRDHRVRKATASGGSAEAVGEGRGGIVARARSRVHVVDLERLAHGHTGAVVERVGRELTGSQLVRWTHEARARVGCELAAAVHRIVVRNKIGRI